MSPNFNHTYSCQVLQCVIVIISVFVRTGRAQTQTDTCTHQSRQWVDCHE